MGMSKWLFYAFQCVCVCSCVVCVLGLCVDGWVVVILCVYVHKMFVFILCILSVHCHTMPCQHKKKSFKPRIKHLNVVKYVIKYYVIGHLTFYRKDPHPYTVHCFVHNLIQFWSSNNNLYRKSTSFEIE